MRFSRSWDRGPSCFNEDLYGVAGFVEVFSFYFAVATGFTFYFAVATDIKHSCTQLKLEAKFVQLFFSSRFSLILQYSNDRLNIIHTCILIYIVYLHVGPVEDPIGELCKVLQRIDALSGK